MTLGLDFFTGIGRLYDEMTVDEWWVGVILCVQSYLAYMVIGVGSSRYCPLAPITSKL